ncbi:MAG: right-handed parallel beta-helix repeat-containing protein [Labilithrix sp.]|nr:right-handed parallel beta-helix repeat-containing protein [Labilithrix sp.]
MITGRWYASFALALAIGGAACGDGGAAAAPPEVASACVEGFAMDPSLGACVEIAAADCPANTMPEIGKAECQPVGWSAACPEGFERDATGWGCVDRVPRAACAGATREDIKTGSCVPIGDCNAPFPPPAATLFVDDDGAEDATHFKTLGAAMAAAAAGATIAVEEGAYAEVIEFEKNDVTVVGRCAEKVKFTKPGGPSGPAGRRAGVFVPGLTGAKLRGVTVSGFRGGVLMEDGELTIEDALIDGNDTLGVYLRFGGKATFRRSKVSNVTAGDELGSGLIVYDGSVLAFEDSAIVDNFFRHATVDGKGSKLEAKRTVFARNTPRIGQEDAAGIAVIDGAALALSQSAVLDSDHRGVMVEGEGSRADLDQSVVRRVAGTLKKSGGVGIWAAASGTVKLTNSAVTDAQVLGLYVTGGPLESAPARPGKAILEKTTFIGVPEGQPVEFGRCVSAAEAGVLEMRDAAVIDCPQAGVALQTSSIGTFERLYVKGSRPLQSKLNAFGGFGVIVEEKSQATITSSSFVGNTLAGLTTVLDAETTAEAVLVRDTREIPELTAGAGLQIARGGRLTISRSAFASNTVEAVLVASGGLLAMSASTVHGTRSVDGTFGHGIAVFPEARAELDGVAIFDNPGVGLVADGGQAFVRGGLFARNAVAVHAQNGTTITQSDVAPADLGGGEMRISSSTRFAENGTRVGSGLIELPNPPIE